MGFPNRRRLKLHPTWPTFILKCLSALLLLASLPGARSQILTSELTGSSGDDEQSAEDIANRTYSEEQSALQRRILRDYNRRVRPVRNVSKPTFVSVHIYLMHLSVQQSQQTISLNGHIYMGGTWTDEVAVWDPVQFNNVRTTITKQWEVWTPELRIANSVGGINQYFDISRRSHTTLTSIDSNTTKVETYPSFSAQIGCSFDYSSYPLDAQICAMQLYAMPVMSEIELEVYHQMDPSLILSWGGEAREQHISDWELTQVTSNMSFYRQGRYDFERPSGGYSSTWTVMLVAIELKRNAGLFWCALLVPALVCTAISILSPLMTDTRQGVALVLVTLLLDILLQRDLLQLLPPSAGSSPRIAKYNVGLVFLTLIALCIQLYLQNALAYGATPSRIAQHVQPILRRLPVMNRPNSAAGKDDEETVRKKAVGDRRKNMATEMQKMRYQAVVLLGIISLMLGLVVFVF